MFFGFFLLVVISYFRYVQSGKARIGGVGLACCVFFVSVFGVVSVGWGVVSHEGDVFFLGSVFKGRLLWTVLVTGTACGSKKRHVSVGWLKMGRLHRYTPFLQDWLPLPKKNH